MGQSKFTLLGKMLIAKSMGMSNFIYSMSLVSVQNQLLKQAQTKLNKLSAKINSRNRVNMQISFGRVCQSRLIKGKPCAYPGKI